MGGTRTNAIVDEKGEGLHGVRTRMRWVSKERDKMRSDIPWKEARKALQKLMERVQVKLVIGLESTAKWCVREWPADEFGEAIKWDFSEMLK